MARDMEERKKADDYKEENAQGLDAKRDPQIVEKYIKDIIDDYKVPVKPVQKKWEGVKNIELFELLDPPVSHKSILNITFKLKNEADYEKLYDKLINTFDGNNTVHPKPVSLDDNIIKNNGSVQLTIFGSPARLVDDIINNDPQWMNKVKGK